MKPDKVAVALIELKERLARYESDVLLAYPTASVFSNAPLALHQTICKASISELKYIIALLND